MRFGRAGIWVCNPDINCLTGCEFCGFRRKAGVCGDVEGNVDFGDFYFGDIKVDVEKKHLAVRQLGFFYRLDACEGFLFFKRAGNFVNCSFGYLGNGEVFDVNLDTSIGLVFDSFDYLAN